MIKNKIILSILLIFLLAPRLALSDLGKKSIIPRFVMIKSNEVNARRGPAIHCPIEWVFVKKGEPVEVVAQYEQWRQIKDIKGEGGWVHSSVLTSKRGVIVNSKAPVFIHSKPQSGSNVVAKVLPDVRCTLKKCDDSWCNVKCNNVSGWILRSVLWGIYADEKF